MEDQPLLMVNISSCVPKKSKTYFGTFVCAADTKRVQKFPYRFRSNAVQWTYTKLCPVIFLICFNLNHFNGHFT